jgi:hypothetical protein
VLELADIFRESGPAYRQAHGPRLLPSHRRALRDIEACRTAALGGHLRACDRCGQQQYAYHSCRNRHCPKCHGDQTRRWLDHTRAQLLPCPYFLATFTLPAELRPLARSHQKVVYGLLMRAAAEALLKLTADPDYLGARPGLLAVLHTWTRAMAYHPHVHILVTAGGWHAGDVPAWIPSKRPDFLVPGRALSILFRAKLRDALRHAGLAEHVPPEAWHKDWVVHLQHAGSGEKVLEYLARYVFRIALVNSRLERFENGQVTFRYRDGRSGKTKHCTLEAPAFIARFLQHVLPHGFSKVRHYGLFSPSRKPLLERAREKLGASSVTDLPPAPVPVSAPDITVDPASADHRSRCPSCGAGVMHVIATLPRSRPPP